MRIADYITSLVDYPGKVCTTLFLPGCNIKAKVLRPSIFEQNELKENFMKLCSLILVVKKKWFKRNIKILGN